jgi:hypothetical protein
VIVEAHLGDGGFGDDAIDADRARAMRIEEAQRRFEDAGARRRGLCS